MESSCSPPTSSTKRPSRREVTVAARGRARCWRWRKREVTAWRGTEGPGMMAESTIGWITWAVWANLEGHGRCHDERLERSPLAGRGARGLRLHLRPRRRDALDGSRSDGARRPVPGALRARGRGAAHSGAAGERADPRLLLHPRVDGRARSEEHTSELQSHHELVCRLLLDKK